MPFIPRCRSRARTRAQARAEANTDQDRIIVQLREYGNQGESTYIGSPYGIACAVTGVVIATKAPSEELSFVSPEAAAKKETAVVEPVPVAIATAVVIRGPSRKVDRTRNSQAHCRLFQSTKETITWNTRIE